jgi:transcriptional regulator with XRE-family HTH domain
MMIESTLMSAGRGGVERAYLVRFGAKLRRLRLEHHLTQAQLAQRAGMHRTFIGQLERGQRGVNLGALPRLATALNVDDPRELLP